MAAVDFQGGVHCLLKNYLLRQEILRRQIDAGMLALPRTGLSGQHACRVDAELTDQDWSRRVLPSHRRQ